MAMTPTARATTTFFQTLFLACDPGLAIADSPFQVRGRPHPIRRENGFPSDLPQGINRPACAGTNGNDAGFSFGRFPR
jgi:hypothetical protein